MVHYCPVLQHTVRQNSLFSSAEVEGVNVNQGEGSSYKGERATACVCVSMYMLHARPCVCIEGWWWECCVSQFFAMMHCFIILHKGHFTCGMGSLWYRQQLEGESALKNRRGRIYSGKKTDSCVLPWQWLPHIRRANRFDAPAVTLHTLMKYGNYSHMKALLDRAGERVQKTNMTLSKDTHCD